MTTSALNLVPPLGWHRRLLLGVASYGPEIKSGFMGVYRFLERAKKLGFSGVELCDRTMPSPRLAVEVRYRLAEMSLSCPVFEIRNDFSDDLLDLEAEITRAIVGLHTGKMLGAQMVRIWTGTASSSPSAVSRVIRGFDALLREAATLGMELTVETHGGISSDRGQLIDVISSVDPVARLGVCIDAEYLDLGPSAKALEIISPFANHCHVKTFEFDDLGRERTIDYASIFRSLGHQGYAGHFTIEFEGSENLDMGVLRSALLAQHYLGRSGIDQDPGR